MRYLILISALIFTTGLSANYTHRAEVGTVVHYSDTGNIIDEYESATDIVVHESGVVAFNYGDSRHVLNDGFKVVIEPGDVSKPMASAPRAPRHLTAEGKKSMMPILVGVFFLLLFAAIVLLYFMKKDNEDEGV